MTDARGIDPQTPIERALARLLPPRNGRPATGSVVDTVRDPELHIDHLEEDNYR